MDMVNIHAAKTHLSRILERVEAGAEVVIARAGKPVARLVPFEAPPRPKRLGLLKGRIHIGADFDAPLPDGLLDLFEGRRQ
ncbi:MAG: type II toxin-antitoxin system Phd/YefM family antitoxin [Acidobacteriota bacterium]